MTGKVIGTIIPAIGGAVVAIGSSLVVIPSVAILVGAIVAFWLTRRYRTQRFYAAIGTLLYISVGGLALILPFVPDPFTQSPVVFLLLFGTISAIIVTMRRLISFILTFIASHVGENRGGSNVWNILSSIVGTVFLAWILVKMKYRLAKTGLAGAATPVGLGINIIAHFFDLPWILEAGLDLTTMIFVGGLLVTFHVLTSWYELITIRKSPTVQAFAEKSKSAGAKATGKSKTLAESATDRANAVSQDDIPGGLTMKKILGI